MSLNNSMCLRRRCIGQKNGAHFIMGTCTNDAVVFLIFSVDLNSDCVCYKLRDFPNWQCCIPSHRSESQTVELPVICRFRPYSCVQLFIFFSHMEIIFQKSIKTPRLTALSLLNSSLSLPSWGENLSLGCCCDMLVWRCSRQAFLSLSPSIFAGPLTR